MREERASSNEFVTQIDDRPAVAPSAGQSRASLTVLSGIQIGRVFHLSREVTLGRGPEATIRLNHASVSRVHATVRALPGGDYEIEDLRSRNGMVVGGHPVQGRCLLRSGDRIELGGRVLLQFSVADQIERQLRESEKLQTIGLLAASVNHDFNNVLTVMTCGLSYMGELDGDTPLSAADVRECLADMRVAAKTAADLTARLGVLIRRGEHALHERVSVSELCDEVVVLLTRIFPKSIVVECDIEPNLVVDGCRAWIHQLLMNPCINARDALAEGGVLRIDARTATAHEVAAHRELGAGPHLLVAISDSGAGMAPEVVAQAFDPLFTTKGSGSGTGLGLATVARVAREHGGAVELQSTLGKGSSVRILLPLNTAGELVPSERPTLDPKAPAKSGTTAIPRVLLVDDDAAIVRAVARVLTRCGHDVVEAADGFQALDRFQCVPRPDVVVMDVDMPGMNGKDCFQQLRTLDPNVKVVFISGYADTDIEHRLRSEGARGFLRKPLALDQLARAITSAAGPSVQPPA